MESISEASPVDVDAPALTVAILCAKRVNFASAQNNVAVLHEIRLTNGSEVAQTGIKVRASAEPDVFRAKAWTIDRLAPGAEIALTDLATELDIARLSALNEAEIGEVILSVESAQTPQIVARRRIELLARDEWGGLGDMAQLLAAFVSPNDAVVAGLLKEASRILERAGHDGALDGYQSGDPGRAWLLAGAIWSAATGLGLSYAMPPASFEVEGQKVRSPGRIRAEGLATCLDSSLLLAAAYEAAGLNPAVLFSQGHAWVGVWLRKRDFGHLTEPDVIAVRKAVQAKDFVPVETTLMTKRPTIGFEHAVDEGRRRLSEDRESEFVMAIDVTRARAARIRPLATEGEAATSDAQEDVAAPAPLPKPIDFGLLPDELGDEAPDTPLGRIERWQRKLLDLSLRNRLLNFKDTKQSLPFLCPDVAALEDELADGRKFTALALREDDPIGARTVSPEDRRRIEEEVARDAFARRQIAVPLTSKEMNNRLLTLFRKAKSDMQEGGTNTLFLAAGFLRWKKSEGDTRSYRAPILLAPVKLERRSAQSEFRVSDHEDDVRINATLFEFLKRDFDLRIPELEDELPRDGSGIDVPLIFEIMRQRVRDVAGFEVVEELALSTFSFSKYLMWKDLVDRTDQLRENRLVRHLVDNPGETFEIPQEARDGAFEPAELDRRLAPSDLLTPLPADSSQLSAVVAAAAGQDFVLIGPPGTGKSQTIANIISQCLAHGRTVLFVAEKAAALDVVHRRLEAHGLGDACLELHSNKTDRKAVLSQLGRSWDRVASDPKREWVEVTESLRVRRDQLNGYVEALHRQGTQGFSVFDAIGMTASGLPEVSLGFASKDAHDAESFRHLVTLARDLQRTHDAVGGRQVFRLVGSDDWSFAWEARLIEVTDALGAASRQLRDRTAAVGARLGLTPDPACAAERVALLKALCSRALTSARDLSGVPDLSRDVLVEQRDRLGADVAAFEAAQGRMAARYATAEIARIPLDQMDADWRQAQTKFWPFSALARRRIRKLLQTYADGGAADPAQDLTALQEARSVLSNLDANPLKPLTRLPEHADLGPLDDLLAQRAAFRDAVDRLKPLADDPAAFGAAVAELSAGPGHEMKAELERLAEAATAFDAAMTAFRETSRGDPSGWPLRELEQELDALRANRDGLSDWTRWVQSRDAAGAQGLGPIVEALEARKLSEPAPDAFARAYAAWWLPLAMDADDRLRRFAHWEHENAIATFRALDDKAAELAPSEVMRRIAHDLPTRDGAPRKSELGVLRHQLGLQRPSMPIRALLSEMPTTFSRLAPCVLMSPLSVAQYLPAGQAAFDVVIFDEASQITTWDAIGAIGRGRQAIIVGDPKQLPPTNFFGRADDGDGDLPEIERDMPSILDEVCGAGIPTRRLDWHYRSRDEALIAFSNHYYYGGGLVTFPAPTTGSEALRFHPVDGAYARGKGRTNAAEAKAIVAMIRARLTDWLELPEASRPTLGVITFNGEQQALILDLLDEARRADGRLEWFFDDEREEPVIVKNLENIQGDERDVMLFSITFGPDLAGKLTMNFGALNSEGGEKRLNVAVTRARRELHVFASIRAEQIDLGRTRALGVNHLKAFLDYAERGVVALPAREPGSQGPAENVFEQAVADALGGRGWEIRTQIGVSGFRIDLGVVHPDAAGAYLAGVECDGAQYHASATARDRDKVRQAVLEGLGWTILRVWSTDWFRNAAAVADRVHAALTTLLADDRERRAREAEAAAEEADGPAEPQRRLPAPFDEESRAGRDPATKTDDALALDEPRPLPPAAEPSPSSNLFAHGFPDRPQSLGPEPVRPARSPSAAVELNPDHFFEGSYSPTLRAVIADIVASDAPLPLSRLARKVARAHGWQQTGRRIATRVETMLGEVLVEDQFGTPFVWPKDGRADRTPFRGLDHRAIREVSRTEIASVIDAHSEELACSEDPTLDLARQLGIARLSSDARAYLDQVRAWRDETGG
ncbi:DUF3320 domain-containing protein [uncultured Albimonas sp.]|uniref:DUF3320 domain-containing protein n=1 Tax=uncultured Albimonas sp. TaxID=1331701 RepID=UPI0030EE69EC